MTESIDKDWNVDRALEFYNIQQWSEGYFNVNQSGHVVAQIDNNSSIDLHQVVSEFRERGYSLPVLVRFPQILHARLDQLCSAFNQAIVEQNINTSHIPVYPIKVNQQQTVVEQVLSNNKNLVGLEVGSKTELLAALGLITSKDGILICNGYKDRSYIRLALYAQRMGIQVFLVLEKLSELKLIEEECSQLNIIPNLGVRVRLNTIAAGNWQNTGGRHAKFGLSITDLLQLLERMKSYNRVNWLRMLHIHMGSQISSLRSFSCGLVEAMRIFAEIYAKNLVIDYIDVGGGLAIDYSAQQNSEYFSKSYSIIDYARTVVGAVADICCAKNLPIPKILTENGRAITAHHAVLVTDVVEVDEIFNQHCDFDEQWAWSEILTEQVHSVLDICKNQPDQITVTLENFQKFINAAFVKGEIDLHERGRAECFVQYCVQKFNANGHIHGSDSYFLANKYYCNFSVFQSTPDVWGLNQIFPIMPLARLDERPTVEARLHDLTCDSDGQISTYISSGSLSDTIMLHRVKSGQSYELGIFLVGAYQEVLGDIHNLFGDTHTVNVELDQGGMLIFTELECGDCVEELLSVVHINSGQILQQCRQRLHQQSADKEVAVGILDEIEDALYGYTYLDSIDRVSHRIKGQKNA